MAEIIRTRLGGDLQRLSREGALGHPEERPAAGLVPGLSEWEYRFHGIGCQLTNRKDGSVVDVDFVDDTHEHIDPHFYIAFLKSLRHPERTESRIKELHPSIDALEIALGSLRATLLMAGRGSASIRFAPEVAVRGDGLLGAVRRWESKDFSSSPSEWIDWLSSGEKDSKVRLDRIANLKEQLNGSSSPAALRGLVGLRVSDLDDHIRSVLRGSAAGGLAAALELISINDDPKWCKVVFEVLEQLSSGKYGGHPYAEKLCLRFLFRHSYRTPQLRSALLRDWGMVEGEVALLAMEYAPDLALPIFRKALRSSIPMSRLEAAAVLALFDRPWSRKELQAVLEESDDHHLTAAARAALRVSHAGEGREAVESWDATHYRPPAEGKFIRIDEGLLMQTDQMVAWHMEEFHDRVMKIRDKVPS